MAVYEFSFKTEQSGFSHILVNYETTPPSYNLWTGSYTYRPIYFFTGLSLPHPNTLTT